MSFANKHLLIMLTSCSKLSNEDGSTGFYYEEMTTPYYAFLDAGINVDIASIQGGKPPHDPDSFAAKADERPASLNRFFDDRAAIEKLFHTLPIQDVVADHYDALFLVGGHGAMLDFPENKTLADLVSNLYKRQAIIGAVCRGVAGLLGAVKEDGTPLVKGKHVNSLTNEEEKKLSKGREVPFLLENRLRELGAIFESCLPFEECVVQDGMLLTGQNAASAKELAVMMVKLLFSGHNKAAVNNTTGFFRGYMKSI